MLNYAGLGVSIFSLISVILALALEHWIYDNTERFRAGLFKGCYYFVKIDKDCFSETHSEAVKAVIGMVFLALFAIVAAIVCQGLKLFAMKNQTRLPYLAAGLMVAAGVFLLIGFAVYVAEVFNYLNYDHELNLGAGFAFCVIGWITSWVSAGLVVMAALNDK